MQTSRINVSFDSDSLNSCVHASKVCIVVVSRISVQINQFDECAIEDLIPHFTFKFFQMVYRVIWKSFVVVRMNNVQCHTVCFVRLTGQVQVVDMPQAAGPLKFTHDEEWLAITRAYHPYFPLTRQPMQL